MVFFWRKSLESVLKRRENPKAASNKNRLKLKTDFLLGNRLFCEKGAKIAFQDFMKIERNL